MHNQRRLAALVGAMVLVCLASAGLALSVLYRSALDEQRLRLAEALDGQVRLIEAIARSEAAEIGRNADSAREATLRQVLDAHRRSRGFGRTGEFVLARRDGDEVSFALSQRSGSLPPLPISGPLGEPMRRAVRGESGSCTCPDYQGETVLAVYAPLPALGMGAVAKIDLAEVRAPFLAAAGIGGVFAVLAISLSAWLLVRFANPLIGSLEESEARNQAIVENAAEGIIAIDEQGLVEALNPAAARIFGYHPLEVIGRAVSLLLPAGSANGDDGPRAQRFGEAGVVSIGREVVGRRKDGASCPVEITVSEAPVAKRRLLTAIVRDLSERKRSEQEREQLHREAEKNARLAEIGALSAKIVHDLGNPLGGLSMQAQLLQRQVFRGDNGEGILKTLTEMMSTVRYVDSLIRQFREFARGHQKLELDTIDLGAFVEELARAWEPQAASKGVALRRSVVAGVPSLRADRAKLRRVLDNLVKNAIEAIDGPGGEVSIEVRFVEPGSVRLSVADTGAGIPQEVQIFRLFETTKPDGTGLGLVVSREIVLAHGGGIEFSRVEPRGTVFHVDLPVGGPTT